MSKTLSELAQLVGGNLIGNGNQVIEAITTIELPQEKAITFASDTKNLDRLKGTNIGAVLVPESLTEFEKPIIQVKHPKIAWAHLLWAFHPAREFDATGSEQAFVHPTASIGNNVTLEPFAVVRENATVGDGSVIRSGAVIDKNATVGSNTVIHPRVMVYQDCQVGSNVILHSGVVVGADGFGYVFDGEKQFKVPQVGNVIIEDNVEIGANSTIDRATVGSTIIRKGVKVDNLVQIAHNCDIGSHTVVCAQVGISGSCTVGQYSTLAGQVGFGDHCEVGNQVIIGAQAGLPTGKKVPDGSILLGSPARPMADMKKQFGAQLRSAETLKVVRDLVKRVEELEKNLDKQEA